MMNEVITMMMIFGDLDFEDHRDPARLEANFILVTIAPLHRGNPLPGD